MRVRRRRAVAAGAVAACLLAVGGSSAASPGAEPDGATAVETVTTSEGVEVSTFGTTVVRPYNTADEPLVAMAVHGVQRVEGATVVYFSVGSRETDEIENGGMSELAAPQVGAAYISGNQIGSVRVVDTVGGVAYGTVLRPSSADSSSPDAFTSTASALPDQAGQMAVMYAVLPELPDEVETVEVDLLFGVTVPDVPVREGYLEPTADPEEPILLGTGWPEIDRADVDDVDDVARFTYPLTSVAEALDASQLVSERDGSVTVDLAADVLFAFDRADLSPQAQTTLAELAQRVAADGATGQITVTGHTDDQGSDAYNQDLSLRRAQSVAAVLQPALADQRLTFAVDGRGESEPVADNGTPEGQQANRRVSVTYTAGDR